MYVWMDGWMYEWMTRRGNIMDKAKHVDTKTQVLKDSFLLRQFEIFDETHGYQKATILFDRSINPSTRNDAWIQYVRSYVYMFII